MALKAADTRYEAMTVYDRTLIETFQALVNSGNYAPGPLVMQLAVDATKALMQQLNFAAPTDIIPETQPVFKVWVDPNNPNNQ
jgi:hypothetical protein